MMGPEAKCKGYTIWEDVLPRGITQCNDPGINGAAATLRPHAPHINSQVWRELACRDTALRENLYTEGIPNLEKEYQKQKNRQRSPNTYYRLHKQGAFVVVYKESLFPFKTWQRHIPIWLITSVRFSVYIWSSESTLLLVICIIHITRLSFSEANPSIF